MNPSRSARVAVEIAVPRAVSQRDSAIRSARYAASVFADRPLSIQAPSRNRVTAGSTASATGRGTEAVLAGLLTGDVFRVTLMTDFVRAVSRNFLVARVTPITVRSRDLT